MLIFKLTQLVTDPIPGEGSWLWQMWAGITSGWYGVCKMELMGWEGEGSKMADVSTGCVCYWLSCHLSSPFQSSARIDWGSPPLCNMTQKMGEKVWAHEHMERKLLLSFRYTHTHRGLLFRCCHLPFGSIKAAFQTCSHIILLDLSQ